MTRPLEFLCAKDLALRLGGKKARKSGKEWVTLCPVHESIDSDPSLSVGDGKNGRIVVHCHAACSQQDLIAKLREKGISLSPPSGSDEKPDATGNIATLVRKGWKLEEAYAYKDAARATTYENVRFHFYKRNKRIAKTFRQRRPDGNGGWIENLNGVHRLPYRLPQLLASGQQDIDCTEGERKADRLAKLGLNATSVATPKDIDLSPFRNRIVFIHADNNAPGRRKAEALASALHGIASSVRIVFYPDAGDDKDVFDWLEQGRSLSDLLERRDEALEWKPGSAGENSDGGSEGPSPAALPLIFGIPSDRTEQRWLADQLLPEVGTALLVGQWGMCKTFVGLDMVAGILARGTFAGRTISRKGGILWLAAEGQSEIPDRLRALLVANVGINLDAFAWAESCPALLREGSLNILVATAREAARQLMERHKIPLLLIIIDTIIAAAGWTDENSAAEVQRVMNTLAALARELQCCVIGIDHLGKLPDTGTRGSSAKEGSADAVLAALGERDLAGNVKNMRLAIRKLRGGPTGLEIPFELRVVELESKETSCVIDWREPRTVAAAKPDRWAKSLRLLRTAIGNALVEHGETVRPYADGSTVSATKVEHARREFAELYVANDDTPAQRRDAARKAFARAANEARLRGLIGVRDEGKTHWIWFATQEDRTRDASRNDPDVVPRPTHGGRTDGHMP